MAVTVRAVETCSPGTFRTIFHELEIPHNDYARAFEQLTTGCVIGGYPFTQEKLDAIRTKLTHKPNREALDRSARIVAKSLFVESKAAGYDHLYLVRLANELLELVNQELANKRAAKL